MKPINEMTLLEIRDSLKWLGDNNNNVPFDHIQKACYDYADRIYDLTRWITVSERMPTEEDADEDGFIDCYGKYGRFPMRLCHIDNLDIGSKTFTHWRRIDKP